MNAPVQIDFTVGKLKFIGVDAPSEDSLAMYEAPNEGNRGACLATVIPPGSIEWTNEALSAWVKDDFLPMVAEAEISDET